MIRIENHLGRIEISKTFIKRLAGNVACRCFGVAGISPLFAGNAKPRPEDGVRLRCKNGELTIDLHILVSYGVNISAIASSIRNKVRYAVDEMSGLPVAAVNVYVDGIKD